MSLGHPFHFLACFGVAAALFAQSEPSTDLVDFVDPMVGAIGPGSCPIGPCLPNASIFPSPNTLEPAAGGYRHGSPIIGFAQLHGQGVGSSTMSYGNFLISPQIGPGFREADHASEMSEMNPRPYAFRGRLDKWGIDCTAVAAARSAIYQFDFPASDDARIYFDVARKLKKTDGMKNGAVKIDLATGTISGGGEFDGNWNPAPYRVFFYAQVSPKPVAGGTWQGDDAVDGRLAATNRDRDELGGWLQFNTTSERTVFVKVAVSFHSVEKAREALEKEIPGWDIAALEQQAKKAWNTALGKVRAPGISDDEARRLYTALYRTRIMPRDRSGDVEGWAPNEPFWDDQYTLWDTWQSLFPLLALTAPDVLASNVNSFAARFKHNGRAETAFIQGKDYQVGQGGDEVDLVIGDAFVKKVPGIDWQQVWPLLEFNARRRTDSYRRLNYHATDAKADGYDWRTRSGTTTIAFAYEDWVTSRVAAALGKTALARELQERSGAWKNLWDDSAEDAGFTGFIRGKSSSGQFTDHPPTSGDDFYQGSGWIYSFNIPHDRAEMIRRMGGPRRFVQRLEYALSQRNNAYIDFTNEPSFQTIWLFSHVGRPYLASQWCNELRGKFTDKGYPGDEDSGAMSSLHFFLTAGFFPSAGQTHYYLHGPRVPELQFDLSNGKTFTVIGRNAGGENIFVQSAKIDGRPLDRPVIDHSQIMAGGTLEFEMGPHPTTWGTNGDFAPPAKRQAVAKLSGPWTAMQGDPGIEGADTDSPVWNRAAGTAIQSPFPNITLSRPGDSLTLTAALQVEGSASVPTDGLSWGLFHAKSPTTDAGWPGYLATSSRDATNAASFQRKASGESEAFHSPGDPIATCTTPAPPLTEGAYRLILTVSRGETDTLDYVAALVRTSDEVMLASFTGSDTDPATFTFNRVGLRAGSGIKSIRLSNAELVANRDVPAPKQAPARAAGTPPTSGL